MQLLHTLQAVFFYIPPLHWLNVIHVISDLTVCYLWIPCSARGLCTFWSIDFWTVKLFPPNFTGLQRQNYKECVIVLKHVGLTVRAQAGMSALPTLGFSDMDMEVWKGPRK